MQNNLTLNLILMEIIICGFSNQIVKKNKINWINLNIKFFLIDLSRGRGIKLF